MSKRTEQVEGGQPVEPALEHEPEEQVLPGGAELEEEKTPAPAELPGPAELPRDSTPRGTGFAVEPITTGLEAGQVRVSALRFRARRANSVSVGLLQARLNELGYGEVRGDLIGWFHVGTRSAVAAWQDSESVGDGTGDVTLEVAQAIFAGTGITVADD